MPLSWQSREARICQVAGSRAGRSVTGDGRGVRLPIGFTTDAGAQPASYWLIPPAVGGVFTCMYYSTWVVDFGCYWIAPVARLGLRF